MTLNEREKTILEATISNYIETGEPVGSKSLSLDDRFNLSAATIRNELSQLEKQGYLSQVHTSSGRVPTDKGYRMYVDSLMHTQAPTPEVQSELFRFLGGVKFNVNETLGRLSELMGSLIDYTTIVVTPTVFQETLKVAHLILVDIDRIMVVLLNSSGLNCEFLVQGDHALNQEDLNALSKLLTSKLGGKALATIDETLFFELVAELPHFENILRKLTEEINRLKTFNQSPHSLLTGGVSNMLRLPEFRNIELTQQVLSALEESKALLHVLDRYMTQPKRSQVVIGEENDLSSLHSCGMVFAPFHAGQNPVGLVGVLGPKRMAYQKVVPMVSHISELITRYFDDHHEAQAEHAAQNH